MRNTYRGLGEASVIFWMEEGYDDRWEDSGYSLEVNFMRLV